MSEQPLDKPPGWGLPNAGECYPDDINTASRVHFVTSSDKFKDLALKFDDEKIPMDLLDPYALEQLALVLKFGAKKYAPNNWRNGLHITRLLGAVLRHTFAYLMGEDNDPETGLSHMAHAMCECMFIVWTRKERSIFDDRYRNKYKSKI